MNTENNMFDKTAVEYDQWFDENENAYQSELLAVKQFIPIGKDGLELGVGTGRFAAELGIQKGIEPAPNMAAMARERGIDVVIGVAENLPYPDRQFDFVLMVAVDCFVDDIEKAYSEVHRVLKPGGQIIIGLLDRNGAVAKKYEAKKTPDNVYWFAHFHFTEETVAILKNAGFSDFEFCQTLVVPDPSAVEKPISGHGKGSFVVIKAVKN
jgi:SAM-dependent methyltransferase